MARIMDAVESHPLPASVAEGTVSKPISPPRRRNHRNALKLALTATGVGLLAGAAIILAPKAILNPPPEQMRSVSAASEQIPPLDTAGISDDPPKLPEIPVAAPPSSPPDTENKSAPVTEKVESYECTAFLPDICAQGVELIDYLNPKGTRVLIAGINLPEGMNETPIFSNITGGLRVATNDPHYAEVGDVNDPTLTTVILEGGFLFENDRKVQPGDKIGRLVKTGVKRKIGNREYDATMAVSVKNPNTGKFYSGDELVRRTFPNAPIVSASHNSSEAMEVPKTRSTVTFEDNRPPE